MVVSNEKEVNSHEKNIGRYFYFGGGMFVTSPGARVTTDSGRSLHNRGKILGFSKSSAQRMRRYLREASAEYKNMVTLTYPFSYPSDGKQVKEHLRRMCQEMHRYDKGRRGYRIGKASVFWFLEFQGRGAPHFHMFTTEDYPKQWIARTWYRIVNSEDDRHLRAGTRIERLRSREGYQAYASKYAAKNDQKTVPDGYHDVGRFWGVSGRCSRVAAAIFIPLSARRIPAIESRLKGIKSRIYEAKLAGKCTSLETKNDKCKVIIMNRRSDRDYIFKSLKLIEVMMSLCGEGRQLISEEMHNDFITDSLHEQGFLESNERYSNDFGML